MPGSSSIACADALTCCWGYGTGTSQLSLLAAGCSHSGRPFLLDVVDPMLHRSTFVSTMQQQLKLRLRKLQLLQPPMQLPRLLLVLAARWAGSGQSRLVCGTRCNSGSRLRLQHWRLRCLWGQAFKGPVACWGMTSGCLMVACLLKKVSQ